MMAAIEGYKATRKEGQQQRRTYVPAVASMGKLAESSSCGQSANMILSPLWGMSCQSASVKKGMNGCSRRKHVSHTYTSTRLEACKRKRKQSKIIRGYKGFLCH